MDGSTIGVIASAVVAILTPVGLAFAWLIKLIVSQSKDTVLEQKKAFKERESKLERQVELWRDRALRSGWKEDQK